MPQWSIRACWAGRESVWRITQKAPGVDADVGTQGQVKQ